MHFKEFRLNREFHSRQQAGVINGAQGLESPGSLRDQRIRTGGFGGLQQIFQKKGVNSRHVAGDQKVPIGSGGAQGGVQAPQWSAACDSVGNDGKAKVPVQFWGPNQRDVPRRVENLAGNRFNQRGPFPWQQRFILAHAGTEPSRQHEPGPSAFHDAPAAWHEAPAAWHEMIVAIAARMSTNKKVYICFITAFAMMLAASPVRAASSSETDSSSLKTPSQKALVVRADHRTGKLVRSVAPVKGSAAAQEPPSANISEIVAKAAHDNNVDPLLVHSIIQVESNYNPDAVSPKGAQGLMQLMPPTARDLGVSDSFDPRQNIEAGVRYLKYLQGLYKDDRLALAAYNAGPGAVQKYRWIPPYPETQDYVNRVGQRYGAAKKAAAQHLAEPAASPVGVTEEKHPKLEPFVDAEGRLHLRTTQQ